MESLRGSNVRNADQEEGDERGNAMDRGVDLGMDGAITPDFARWRLDGAEDVAEGEPTGRRLIREWAHFSRSRRSREVDWRDEFDEDRVGEENF